MLMNNVKFSLVIPFYNSFNNLKNCLNSIKKSTHKPNEIIIIDDHSSISQSIRCRSHLSRFQNTKYFRLKKNIGPGGARNFGVNKSSYEFIFFLDSDTEVMIDTFYQFLLKAVSFNIQVGIYDLKPATKNLGGLYKSSFYYFLYNHNKLENYDHFSASCAVIKKNFFLRSKGYDIFFSKGIDFENEELGYRLSKQYNMVLNTKMRVRHNFPSSNKILILFFQRTQLWMEMFLIRKKFSSKATNSSTALSLLISPLIIILLFIYIITNKFIFLALLTLIIIYQILIYKKFYCYHFNNNKLFLPRLYILSNMSNISILLGSLFGVFKYFLNISKMKKKFLK
jgi:glycosyltransferase involved in cell wall biosynthesis